MSMMYSKISKKNNLKGVRKEVGKIINGTGCLCPCRQGLPLPGKWMAGPARSQILSSAAGTISSLVLKEYSFLVFFFCLSFVLIILLYSTLLTLDFLLLPSRISYDRQTKCFI